MKKQRKLLGNKNSSQSKVKKIEKIKIIRGEKCRFV